MSENHVALYRKYRPQSFSDVVGQEQSVSLLEKSIASEKGAVSTLISPSLKASLMVLIVLNSTFLASSLSEKSM